MSLLPTKGTARDPYKKVQTHISERIGYTPGKIIASDIFLDADTCLEWNLSSFDLGI